MNLRRIEYRMTLFLNSQDYFLPCPRQKVASDLGLKQNRTVLIQGTSNKDTQHRTFSFIISQFNHFSLSYVVLSL